MITTDLLEFVKKERSKKVPDNDIKNKLENIGWKSNDIKFALAYDYKENIPVPPYDPEIKNVEKGYQSIWDGFLHILMFISMYVSAISFGDILFSLVDYYVPDLRYRYNYYSSPLENTEFPMAALIVTFPIFIFLFLKIARMTKENPYVRNLLVRKVLIYLTLVVTFVTTIVTLIAIVFGLLSGEVSGNFGLKAVIVIGLSTLVFTYYLNQVKADRKEHA